MRERSVLVTGADGAVGARVVAAWLTRTDRPVRCWVRAADDGALARRRAWLTARLGPSAARLEWARGDLRDAEPFAGIDPREVGTIVHAAAVTRFNVAYDEARTVNVEGTRKLLAFARRCPRLEAIGLLGTIYACGLAEGTVEEAPFPAPPGFANHYERSKWEAEAALLGEAGDLPWRLFRLATVIADDESGAVGEQNAVHHTLRLLHHGLLPLVPGDPATPVYLVTADFAARAIVEILETADARGIYHLAHRPRESLTLEALLDVVFRCFEQDPGFRARRILRPLLCDAESFALLVDGLDGCAGPIVRQGLASVAPFAPQLFRRKVVANDRLRAAIGAYWAPDARALVRRTCDHLLRTRFGRRSDHAA